MTAQTRALTDAVWATPAANRLLPATASRGQWLAARATGIGGSDIAALLGLSEWGTRMGVYADKIGRPDESDNDAMEWGRRLEDAVVDYFEDNTGIVTRRVGLVRSRQHPVAVASLDRLTDCSGVCDRPDGILETKTTNWRQEEKWDDDQIPDSAELQAVWYLGVTGRSHAHVVCLVDGRRPIMRTVQANPELFTLAVEVANRFWTDHVLTRRPPSVDDRPVVLDEVKRIYPQVASERAIVEPDVVDPVLDAYIAAKAHAKEVDEEIAVLGARLRLMLGDAAELVTAGEVVATCKTTNAKRFDQTAFKADHPGLAATYTKPAPYRALLIKRK